MHFYEIHGCFLLPVATEWKKLTQQNSPRCLDVTPLHDADSFLLQDDVTLFPLESLKHILIHIYIYIFSIQIIKSTCSIIFLNLFPNFFLSDEKFVPGRLYLFIKGLIFVVLGISFLISSWFNLAVTVYWKHLLSFLLIGFVVAFLLLSN